MHYKKMMKNASDWGYEIRRGDYYGCGGSAQHDNNGDQWYVDQVNQPRCRMGPGHATVKAAYDAVVETETERDKLKIQYPNEDWAG